MIIPQFWAEANLKERINGRSVSLRRFGWSDVSEAEARVHAESRVNEAMERARAGQTYHRQDHKVPYNGADGLPIREEILARHGPTIITRNSYGAHCLNTPDGMFIDIDTPEPVLATRLGCCLLLLCVGVHVYGLRSDRYSWAIGAGAVFLLVLLLWSWFERREKQFIRSRLTKSIRRTLQRFLDARPDWRLRLYETPNGFRLLALHRRFDPLESEVAEVFRELGADPMYVKMCISQNCFRARVSPKPWRIGIPKHLRPRPGVWPINPDRLADRQAWVARYEEAAREFASCRFLEEFGTGSIDPYLASVQRLHDQLCQADRELPMG
jgi:hypothetical protein